MSKDTNNLNKFMDLFGLSKNKKGWNLKGMKLGRNENKKENIFFFDCLVEVKMKRKENKNNDFFSYSNGDIKEKKFCMFNDDYNLTKLVWRIKPTRGIFEK